MWFYLLISSSYLQVFFWCASILGNIAEGRMVQIPRLREWRETRALSQVELAELADLSSRSVAGYEAGAGARPSTVRRLAEVLGVEVTELRGDTEHPLEEAPPSPEQPNFNGLIEEERRESAHQNAQNAWYDYITQEADRIASEADRKGYAPDWIKEIDELPRKVERVLFDSGVLGKDDTYRMDAEWRQSGDIADALAKLKRSVEQAWRAQIREAEKQDQRREAAAKLDSIRKRSEQADKSSKEALEAIRDERRDSA